MKMPKATKKLWIDALRGGEYRQAIGVLKTVDGHCCLGVLEEVLGTPQTPHRSGDPRAPVYFQHPGGSMDTTLLTKETAARFDAKIWGFKVPVEKLPQRILARVPTQKPGSELSLVDLNDSGASFDEIAAVIELWVEEEEDEHGMDSLDEQPTGVSS